VSLFKQSILINLDKRQDRLERFDAQAKALGIDYERFQAIESTDPVLGCKLSHVAALIKCKGDSVFIFEDDAVFVDNFQEELDKSLALLPDDWDMVYLGAHILRTEVVNDRWRRSIESSSTHAYAVRASVIPKLVDTAIAHKGHVDVAYSSLHNDLKAYIARPTLVSQEAGFSDIQKVEVDYNYLYF
jgi:GR25 family glycosyltransferase involved in LPS biosynthesis